jgi:hypothetical protein
MWFLWEAFCHEGKRRRLLRKTIACGRLSVYNAVYVAMPGKKSVGGIIVTALCIIR